MASAPAMNRRGGGSRLAMVRSARASLAGSPDCWPFCDLQNSIGSVAAPGHRRLAQPTDRASGGLAQAELRSGGPQRENRGSASASRPGFRTRIGPCGGFGRLAVRSLRHVPLGPTDRRPSRRARERQPESPHLQDGARATIVTGLAESDDTAAAANVAAGYVLAQAGTHIGPEGLTLSACLAEMAPGAWALEWVGAPDEREAHATALGITPERLPDLLAWTTNAFGTDFLWPHFFPSLTVARDFHRLFLPARTRLLGFALPADLVDGFLTVAAPPPPPPGYSPGGPTGAVELLQQRRPLEPGGAPRGFEPLGYEVTGQFCSFRCNGLETHLQREFGTTFNEWGLLENEHVARRCAEYAGRPATAPCAPYWHPWLIHEYDPRTPPEP